MSKQLAQLVPVLRKFLVKLPLTIHVGRQLMLWVATKSSQQGRVLWVLLGISLGLIFQHTVAVCEVHFTRRFVGIYGGIESLFGFSGAKWISSTHSRCLFQKMMALVNGIKPI